MIKNKTVLAVIPARAGSKRLPNKNIIDLNGKPLIVWSINAGLGSKYIDELIVSTDSKKIATIAKRAGSDVPFIRPKALATDTATSYDVAAHALKHYQNRFDIIILLQPTSPLRTSRDIDAALEFFMKNKANAVVSVCETEHSPLLCNVLPKDLSMKGFLKNKLKKARSQELPKYYRINGGLYIVSVKNFLKEKTFFLSKKIYAYVMPKDRSVDIDNKSDLDFAKFLIRRK